jgi:hypothetical protein
VFPLGIRRRRLASAMPGPLADPSPSLRARGGSLVKDDALREALNAPILTGPDPMGRAAHWCPAAGPLAEALGVGGGGDDVVAVVPLGRERGRLRPPRRHRLTFFDSLDLPSVGGEWRCAIGRGNARMSAHARRLPPIWLKTESVWQELARVSTHASRLQPSGIRRGPLPEDVPP